MLRFLSDENFNGAVVRGLMLRSPDIDCIRIQDAGLNGMDDPTVLEWAANQGRILLSHDRATIPDFAYARTQNGEAMPGIFIFNDRSPVNQMIQELLLLDECSEQMEWSGMVVYLPL